MKDEREPRKELTGLSSHLARAPSYASSIANVLWTVFFGYLVSLHTISLMVFVFVVASKVFSVMFLEDGDAPKKTAIYSVIALSLLVPLLTGLSFFEITVGILILIVYSVYPVCKGRAPFDVVHHVLRYVFIFMLGLGSLAFFSEKTLLALSTIVIFSVAGELLVGLGRSGVPDRSVVSLLGVRRSMTAVVFLVFAGSIMASFVLNILFEFPIQVGDAFIPFYIIPALALDIYLTVSLIKAHSKSVDLFRLVRKKEVMAIALILLSVLVVFQTARIGTRVVVSSRDYSFNVGVRTIISGVNSWDVPWIVFNYVNDNNYYYVVFHKNGLLELSQKIDGHYLRYMSSLETPLTPFQWHNFLIVLNETTIVVSLDGEYQVTASRQLVTDTSSIVISPSMPSRTGIWIAGTYRITVYPESNG